MEKIEASAGLMKRAELVDMIAGTIREFSKSAQRGAPAQIDENTTIFGRDGFLDSMSLLNVVLDVEQEVQARYGVDVSLTDDRAVSQKRSPFRSVGSLADYILGGGGKGS